MSTPINALSNFQIQPDLIKTGVEPINDIKIFSPFAQVKSPFDLSSILINTPKVEVAPETTTYGLHDEHEQETGQTVSYDPSDPGSLFSTAEQLAKSPSSQDKIKAQELFMKFQELLQLEIQKASILHDMAMSAIKAMRG